MRPRCPGGGHSVVVSDLAEPGAAESARRRGERRRDDRPARRQRRRCRAPAGSTSFSTEEVARARQGQPRVADPARAGAAAGDERARLRPPRLRLLARRQGRLAARLDLQRDQVRPARLRAGAARGPRRDVRRRRLGRPARASSATPACSPTPERSSRRASGTVDPGGGRRRRRQGDRANRAEVAVAPPQQRALVGFAHIFPSLAGPCPARRGDQGRRGPRRGQSDKR